MFVLSHARELFQGKYALVWNERRQGYWAIFTKSIAWCPKPIYEFNWPTISEEEFKEKWPTHYSNYEWHKFLLEESILRLHKEPKNAMDGNS